VRGGRTIPLLAALILATTVRSAAADCGGPCGVDAVCARKVSACLLAADDHEAAVKVLKAARAAHPDDSQLARLLAKAYLGAGNRIWALKTLLGVLEAAPADLEARSWAVWLSIQDGDLEQADRLLDQAPATATGPLRERFELLTAVLAKLRDDEQRAAATLEHLDERGADLFPEDVALYESVRSQLRGPAVNPLQARAMIAGGYTSNAVQSAPQDVGAGLSEAGAPVLSADLVLRFEPWMSPLVRPLGEVRTKGFMPTTDHAQGLSYLSLAGRAGGELGERDALRVRLLYGYELLGLWDKGWFMEAHRGDVELDIRPWFQLFGGAGRRSYDHQPKTRTEMDVGMAAVFPLAGGWNVTGFVGARTYFAKHEAFDGRGLTGLARVRIPLPADFMIKLRVMGLYDVYPYSQEYYRADDHRQDFVVRTEAGPWTPSWLGVRLGATYNLAHRVSTIDTLVDDFNFTDHRFLLQLRWQGSLDPTLPSTTDVPEGHVPLPYGLAGGGDTGLDRVQDLLRQEDSARRGSMCVD